EWFNTKRDHACTFAVHRLPHPDLPAALAARFGLRPRDFPVEPLADLDRELRAVFARFLFLFREPAGGGGDYLTDPRGAFLLMDEGGASALLEELGAALVSLGATAGWRVWPTLAWESSDELREGCFQDNVALALPDQLCLLHFGVSD